MTIIDWSYKTGTATTVVLLMSQLSTMSGLLAVQLEASMTITKETALSWGMSVSIVILVGGFGFNSI